MPRTEKLVDATRKCEKGCGDSSCCDFLLKSQKLVLTRELMEQVKGEKTTKTCLSA